MKKQLILILLVFITTAGSILAQGTMEQKPNARAKETYFKLKTDLTLVGEQDAKVYQVFEDYYTTIQKVRDEMSASGSMDREKMKDNMQRVSGVRDAKLKVILTEEQMKKWVNEVEPAMHPQRKKEEQKQ